MLPRAEEMQNVTKQGRKAVATWMRIQTYVHLNQMKEGHKDFSPGDQG